MRLAYFGRMSVSRILISSGSDFESTVGYSRAVRTGPHVVVSGTTGSGNEVTAQTRDALRRIAIALEQAGAALSDVVRTRIYVTDIGHWREVAAVHSEVFEEIRPAATMVEVAALIAPDLLVEIEADAYIQTGGKVPSAAGREPVTLITAPTGNGPYRCGNTIDSGSVGTPGSQRMGESRRAGSMCSSTRSLRPR